MKIGQLAEATGTLVPTIRFYEREGLLQEPERTDSNYRIYDQSHVERLAFIRHCRSLDMALDEVRALLQFKQQPCENCSGVNELLDKHIVHVADRIRELRALEKQLRALRQQCSQAQAAADCGILRELGEAATPARRPPARHVHGAH